VREEGNRLKENEKAEEVGNRKKKKKEENGHTSS